MSLYKRKNSSVYWVKLHHSGKTPTHELQRMGGWKTTAMVERYAHVAPDHLS